MSALNSKKTLPNPIAQIFSTAAFPSSETATSWVAVRGFDEVEFYFVVSNQQSVANLYVKIEYTDDHGSSRTFPVTVEEFLPDETPPIVKQYEYIIHAENCFSATKLYYAIPCPTHGQFMRVKFYGGPSVGTDEVQVWVNRKD